ncbi:MAG: hypothetical protein A2Y62_14570 [Candidatus Fischerbacteria bacterium RBG_13_37_8]|uniref:Uncharacterized protein n=1 Tax=Candidatus Fischerbacteria bacterium RBG_13_37_8 TaxID=1817863 RepID=A0A1F5V6S9_9BACT|nr:MAG: hypothetical protein A2Y62_14570 [Candidatus Fischerbacteria bacterium RBG_13_37_8]
MQYQNLKFGRIDWLAIKTCILLIAFATILLCSSAFAESENAFDSMNFAFNENYSNAQDVSSFYSKNLTIEERIACQKAIEGVYWKHRTWPKENHQPKPPLEAIVPDDVIRAKVEDTLRKSNAFEYYWQRPITGEQLQAEMERIGKNTKKPLIL